MKKIIAIGCPGSGKSTLVFKMKDILNVPVLHLDKIYHIDNQNHITREELVQKVDDFAKAHDSWIIDGNYISTVEQRIKLADTVLLLDLPTEVCVANAIKRSTLEKTADLADGFDNSKVSDDFLNFIKAFKENSLPKIMDLKEKYQHEKNFVIFENYEQIDQFVENLKKEKKLYPSREKAKQAVESGRVLVDGKVVTKPSFLCEENATLQAKPFEFVSRGGFKLQKALEEFDISLVGRTVLDIGASTGGFSDVCLQNGAKKVYAVDTGEGQLVDKIKNDARVCNMEKTNYLTLSKEKFADVDFVCIDVSFVSLTKLAEKLAKDFCMKKIGGRENDRDSSTSLCSAQNDSRNVDIVALIKPQFECGVEYARKHKGVVKDEKMHKKIVNDVVASFEGLGFIRMGVTPSPIKGGDGNTEFLLWLRRQ